MKPRLKLTIDGHISVVIPGTNPWDENSARLFLIEHYGSVKAFTRRFGLSYSAACVALATPWASERAGKVAKVRQALGLACSPTKQALIAAAALQRKREAA